MFKAYYEYRRDMREEVLVVHGCEGDIWLSSVCLATSDPWAALTVLSEALLKQGYP